MTLLLISVPLMIVGVVIAVLPLVLTLTREPRAGRTSVEQVRSAAAEVRSDDEQRHGDLLRAATEAVTRRDEHERVLVSA